LFFIIQLAAEHHCEPFNLLYSSYEQEKLEFVIQQGQDDGGITLVVCKLLVASTIRLGLLLSCKPYSDLILNYTFSNEIHENINRLYKLVWATSYFFSPSPVASFMETAQLSMMIQQHQNLNRAL
jgi:hypothetical protein